MYSGPVVSLEQLLSSREVRAHRQREWLESHSRPLISFTINMVGDVKVNTISKIAFERGVAVITGSFQRQHHFDGINENVTEDRNAEQIGTRAHICHYQSFNLDTGYEFFAAVDAISAQDLKTKMVQIEDKHPLGRLFDIDVIDVDGFALSRDNMGLPRRQCIICNDDAKICTRSRRHSKQDIVNKMASLVM